MKVNIWKYDDRYSIECDEELVKKLVDTITNDVDTLVYDSEYDKAKDYLIARSKILEAMDSK